MERLFTILTALFTVFSMHAQFHYRLKIEPINGFSKKPIISEIRNNNILVYNLKTRDTIEFDSPNLIDSSIVAACLVGKANILSFQRTKNDLTFVNDKLAGGVNCSNAAQVCSNQSVSGNNSGFGTQELNSSNQGCLLGNEHESSWFYIYIQNPGTLEMLITPTNNQDDYDFAIWGPFTESSAINNCPPTSSPIRCSWAGADGFFYYAGNYYGYENEYNVYWGYNETQVHPSTGMISSYYHAVVQYYYGGSGIFTVTGTSEDQYGDGYVTPLNVSAGQVYLLLVDNYSATNSPYTLTWGGTSTLGCVPVVLGADIVDFSLSSSEGMNILKFTTNRETNIDFFEIEHSIDGFNWYSLEKLEPSNNLEGYTYTYNHKYYAQNNYYRLKTIDFDGEVEIYSGILYYKNEIIQFVKYYNLIGQEVSPDTKGLVIAVDAHGNKYKIYK